MNNQRERAARRVEIEQHCLAKATRGMQGTQLRPDKCSQLHGIYFALGISALVAEQQAAPMIDAFCSALHYWLIWPGTCLTNESIDILETAVLCRDWGIIHRVVRTIRQPYEELLTNPYHRLSQIIIAAITGEGDAAEHRKALATGTKYHTSYAKMLGGVLDLDVATLHEGAAVYLRWHKKLAEKGSLRHSSYGLAALPVLACLRLARVRGLVIQIDDPYLPICAVE